MNPHDDQHDQFIPNAPNHLDHAQPHHYPNYPGQQHVHGGQHEPHASHTPQVPHIAYPISVSNPPAPTISTPTLPALDIAAPSVEGQPLQPVPVVKVLSPVGVEYVFMTFSLFVTATAIVGVLLSLINGGTDFTSLAFPAATLVVSLPVFSLLFLHLKRLELQTRSLRLDPSKRRSTQVTQIVSFLASFFTLIGFAYAVMASMGGLSDLSIGKAALDAAAIFVISAGILAYYWHDEHKAAKPKKADR